MHSLPPQPFPIHLPRNQIWNAAWYQLPTPFLNPPDTATAHPLTHALLPQLTREDEASTGSDEREVRREDQDQINTFSRLHQRELGLEEELKAKSKEKEDLEEVAGELELVDDDAKVP